METGVYASIDLGEFNAAVKAESWAAKMREWLEKPATIERYLEILPELEFMHSAYDVTQGVYGSILLRSSMPKPADDWLNADKAADELGWIMAEKDHRLWLELEAMSATYPSCADIWDSTLKTGLDQGLTLEPIRGSGLRRLHSLITSKTVDRIQHRRDQEELMRNLYTEFKGDIYIEDAIKATRVAIKTAAKYGVTPRWSDSGSKIQSACEVNCSQFYALKAQKYFDGMLTTTGSEEDCSLTLELMFADITAARARAIQIEDSIKPTTSGKVPSLQGMSAKLKAKMGETFNALSADQQQQVSVQGDRGVT